MKFVPTIFLVLTASVCSGTVIDKIERRYRTVLSEIDALRRIYYSMPPQAVTATNDMPELSLRIVQGLTNPGSEINPDSILYLYHSSEEELMGVLDSATQTAKQTFEDEIRPIWEQLNDDAEEARTRLDAVLEQQGALQREQDMAALSDGDPAQVLERMDGFIRSLLGVQGVDVADENVVLDQEEAEDLYSVFNLEGLTEAEVPEALDAAMNELAERLVDSYETRSLYSVAVQVRETYEADMVDAVHISDTLRLLQDRMLDRRYSDAVEDLRYAESQVDRVRALMAEL